MEEKKITELTALLKSLTESYRLLVGAAQDFNGIALAHKNDLEHALDRADDLGDIIDDVVRTLDHLMGRWLHDLKEEPGATGIK